MKEQNALSAGCEPAGHTSGQGSDLAPCKILSLDLKSLALGAFQVGHIWGRVESVRAGGYEMPCSLLRPGRRKAQMPPHILLLTAVTRAGGIRTFQSVGPGQPLMHAQETCFRHMG